MSSTGGQTALERVIDRNLGNGIHLFLSMLGLLILVAAAIVTFDTVVRNSPKLGCKSQLVA